MSGDMETRLSKAQEREILQIAQCYLGKSVVLAGKRGWSDKDWNTTFVDSCGCFSEYTTIPCSLTVFLEIDLSDGIEADGFEFRGLSSIVHDIKNFAGRNLHWTGCENCENELDVDVRLFPRRCK